jgi:hypothetical protein
MTSPARTIEVLTANAATQEVWPIAIVGIPTISPQVAFPFG